MTTLIDRARDFARAAHAGQVRKYTGEPYFVHCEEVAQLVRLVGGADDMIAAAYLHDVVEDCGVTFATLNTTFNSSVAVMVSRLSDLQTPADGNRAKRKANERTKLQRSGPAVQTIKVADLMSNCRSITEHDPGFAKVYLAEMRATLDVMMEAERSLWNTASEMCDTAIRTLEGTNK